MRTIHLYLDRPGNAFVQGFSSGNPLTALEVAQSDKLEIVLHNAVRNTAVPSVTPFVERPLTFGEIRAAIGRRDAAPDRGTFKLRVAGQTTAALTWPTDLTVAGLATWKAAVLAALVALSNIAPGDIVADDPASTPVNFFYFTWTDPEREDAIEVVENRLLPLTQSEVLGSLTSIGYTQLVKLTQFPLAMTSDFERPLPPAVTVAETQPGGAGVNAEQTIIVPSDSTGSVAFIWSGAQTTSLAVQTMTATSIGAALNAIVTDGASNPSFRVSDRPARAGKRFAVEFLGPLAAAAQAMLAVAMIDQESVPYATGIIDLAVNRLGIEQALNGASEVTLDFEVVIDDGGEETFLRPILIVNDMTSGDTEEDADAAGAINTVTETIYIDESMMTPFASVAPGFSFSPVAAVGAGVTQSIAHNLGTLNPRVWVLYESSLAPEYWRELQLGGEYDWHSTDANHVALNLVYALTTGPSDDFYFGRFKVFVSSPDAIVEIFADLAMTWDQVRASLPAGQTVTAKFAAIDAALGILGGSLTINASNITGLIQPGQIDIEALARALKLSAEFLNTLRALITDSEIIDNIGTALRNSATFLGTLKTLLTDSGIIETLAGALLKDSTFMDALRTILLDLLTGTQPRDSILIRIADIDTAFPALLAGSTPSAPLYPFLPAIQNSPTNGGSLTGYAPKAASGNAGTYRTVVTAAHLAPHRRKSFANGDIIFSDGQEWWRATVDGVEYYPAEFDRQLFAFAVNDSMLSLGTRFSLAFGFTVAMPGNCDGYWLFELKRGTANSAGAGPVNLSTVTWDETVISRGIVMADAAVTHNFAYTVTRSALDVLSATKTSYLGAAAVATAPAAPRFVLLAQLTHFDVSNVAKPAGQVRMAMKAATASIVRL